LCFLIQKKYQVASQLAKLVQILVENPSPELQMRIVKDYNFLLINSIISQGSLGTYIDDLMKLSDMSLVESKFRNVVVFCEKYGPPDITLFVEHSNLERTFVSDYFK
jgi:hypothetical protein